MNQRPTVIVWWILWLTFQTGIGFFYYFLGGVGGRAPAAGADGDSSLWLIALGPLFLSVVMRWVFVERTVQAQRALAFFILGIAMAESVCFIGLFLAPAHKLELFILSALGIAQFIPVFASRFTR